MANLIRRRQEEPSSLIERFDPLRTVRDLLRWDPFGRDMLRGDVFGDMEPFTGTRTAAVFMPDIEIKETKDAVVLKVELPGMGEEEVDVSISGNRVTLSGRREDMDRREDDRYYAYEFSYGTFSRTFTLPEGVNPDAATAELKNGVLTVTIPKRESTQPRRIALGKGEEEGKQEEGRLQEGKQQHEGKQQEGKQQEGKQQEGKQQERKAA